MSNFDIHSLVLQIPPTNSQQSKLGAMLPKVYHHLYDAAGNFSRPSSVRRGVTTMWSPPYEAPQAKAHTRSSDLAIKAVAKLKAYDSGVFNRVGAVMHTQSTLDQQIVGSTCLRLEQQYFEASKEAAVFGQMGTAGIPTVLMLAQHYDQMQADLIAITASDKWIAPFFRKFGQTIYADCGGCLIGGRAVDKPIARIHKITTVCDKPLSDFWKAEESEISRFLINLATRAVDGLFPNEAASKLNNISLIGDGHGGDIAAAVSLKTGIKNLFDEEHSYNKIHMSSASVLMSIKNAIDVANQRCETMTVAVWTASVSGHAGALLVECYPESSAIEDGWISYKNTN